MEFLDDRIWTPIHTLPGFECCIEYFVNKQGQVMSTKGRAERILKPRINCKGYAQVNLTQRLGRQKPITALVHKLVALAYLPPPSLPPGRLSGQSRIIHVDGNRSNNDLANLKWTKIEERT